MGAWRERNFRLLFVGQTTSALGNTLVPVALAFAVLDLTRSAGDLGYVLGIQAVALVVFLLPGGVVADRLPRRAVMLASDSVRGVAQAVIGLLLVTGHPAVDTIAALAAVTGAAEAVFTPASSGLTPSLVGAADLHQANALQQTSAAAAGIAGPAIAGILVVTVGPGWALLGDSATFGVSVLLLARLRLDDIPRPVRQRFVADLRDGRTDFWSRDWFRTVVLGASVFNLLYAAYTVLGPVSSDRYYHGAGAWATVSTAGAVGSVAAGLVAVKLRPRHPLRVAVPLVGLAALAPLAFAARLPIPVIAVAAGFGGAGFITFETLWQTSVQRHIPEDRLSRASSYDYFGSLVAFPVGLALAGPVAAAAGLDVVLVLIGLLLAGSVAAMMLSQSVRDLTDAPPPGRAAP